jgi:hypothetical protein
MHAVHSRALRAHLVVLAGYAVLTGLMTWPLLPNFLRAIPGDSFDGWQNYWNLWWIKIALVDRITNPWVTDLLYAPTGVRLYFHTLNPFNGLFTLPVQLSVGLMAAYNTVVWVSWTLAGYGMFLLTRWLLRPKPAAQSAPVTSEPRPFDQSLLPPFLAGLVFTFAPFHMAHLLGHMQVMSLQWIPFYVLSLMRALDRRRSGQSWLPTALLAGFFLVLVGLCDWYFVLYLFFFTGLLVLWHWGSDGVRASLGQMRRRTVDPRVLLGDWLRSLTTWLLPPLVAAGLFVLVLSPVLIPMVREATLFSFMVRPVTDLYTLSASAADFVIPNRLHTLFRPESFGWIGNQVAPVSERTIAIGYLPLLLTLVAAALDRRRVLFWLASALFFFALALGPRIHLGNITTDDIPAAAEQLSQPPEWTPFAVLNRSVPFMRISRSVSRYALMVQFAVAVAAGLGAAALMNRLRTRQRVVTSLALLLPSIVLLEYWVAPYPISPPDTPAFYTELREMPEGNVLNLPMNYDRPGYLLYQTVHQKPLSVAYISRDDPRTLVARAPVLQHFRHLGPDILDVDPVDVGLTVLNDLGIAYVVLDRYKMPGGEERAFTEDLANALFAGERPIFEDERLTVYATPAVDEPQPYLVLGEVNWGPLRREGESAARRVAQDAAPLYVRHAPADSALHIRYRTPSDQAAPVGESPLQVRRVDTGEALPVRPADVDELVVDLGGADAVELTANPPGGVLIEQIGLETYE